MFFGVWDDVSQFNMFRLLAYLNIPDYDMVTMFDDAFKQQPTNEELGAQTFFANVRTGNWKVAQQVLWTNSVSGRSVTTHRFSFSDCRTVDRDQNV